MYLFKLAACCNHWDTCSRSDEEDVVVSYKTSVTTPKQKYLVLRYACLFFIEMTLFCLVATCCIKIKWKTSLRVEGSFITLTTKTTLLPGGRSVTLIPPVFFRLVFFCYLPLHAQNCSPGEAGKLLWHKKRKRNGWNESMTIRAAGWCGASEPWWLKHLATSGGGFNKRSLSRHATLFGLNPAAGIMLHAH